MVNFNSVIIGDCKFSLICCDVCLFIKFAQELCGEVPEVVKFLDKLLVKLADAQILLVVDRSQDEVANLLQPSSSYLSRCSLERGKNVFELPEIVSVYRIRNLEHSLEHCFFLEPSQYAVVKLLVSIQTLYGALLVDRCL